MKSIAILSLCLFFVAASAQFYPMNGPTQDISAIFEKARRDLKNVAIGPKLTENCQLPEDFYPETKQECSLYGHKFARCLASQRMDGVINGTLKSASIESRFDSIPDVVSKYIEDCKTKFDMKPIEPPQNSTEIPAVTNTTETTNSTNIISDRPTTNVNIIVRPILRPIIRIKRDH